MRPVIPLEAELAQYWTVFLLLLAAVVVPALMLAVPWLLAPKHPTPVKGVPYECGEIPLGSAWLRFNVRFYIVALVFVVFDVGLVLLYPVAEILRACAEAPGGTQAAVTVLLAMLLFCGLLTLGLAYVWSKGDLGWVRTYRVSHETGLRSWEQPPAAPPAGAQGER